MNTIRTRINSPVLWMGVLFLLYMALRIFAWENTVLLEGVDGVFYLEQIDTFASLEPGKIAALPPDVTPFYPFFGALFRLPFWSTEFAARLCSLVFSALLFFSLVRIGGRIAAPLSVGIGLLCLAIFSSFSNICFTI